MLILKESIESERVSTILIAKAHVNAQYDEVSDSDSPEFTFGYFDYETRHTDVAKEMNKWEIEIGPQESDVAVFEDVEINDAYFEDESDGSTGIIEVWIEVQSLNPLSESDMQTISEAAVEYMVDDANVAVYGTWYGEVEYWDGYSYEPSYKMDSGELSESARVSLDTSTPITFEIHK